MESAIYEGVVGHRRFVERRHTFRYRLFMMYLDLDELETVFEGSRSWSTNGWALAQFRRRDHFGDPQVDLKTQVKTHVQQQLGFTPLGAVRVLTHLRYFGYCFNPLSVYYCFDADNQQLEAVVAEVTNTPWGQKIAYCLDVRGQSPRHRGRFAKQMHVSPFLPMDMDYDWRGQLPGERLAIYLSVWRDGQKSIDATLNLHRRPISPAALRHLLWRFPLMTLQVIGAIHWEALKLWWRGVSLYSHPKTTLSAP